MCKKVTFTAEPISTVQTLDELQTFRLELRSGMNGCSAKVTGMAQGEDLFFAITESQWESSLCSLFLVLQFSDHQQAIGRMLEIPEHPGVDNKSLRDCSMK